jgi:hypothetical protein
MWPGRTHMAMQSAYPLYQQIHRGNVADKNIEVNVKALFEYLCAHDD